MAHVRSLFFKGPLADVENKAITAFKLGRPSDVIWNITNRCNLLCDHCYMAADGHSRPDELTDEETIALVHQMGERGLPALFLSGGEPMMRKNFWEILELARSYGIRVTVSTNCTLIDRDAAKRLKADGIDWIATSLYGPDDFHDEMVRVPGTRARVIEAIRILREEGVGVAIKTAISQDTWPHIYDLIAEARALDCGLIYFCDLITAGRSEGEDDGRITAEQWRELAEFIIEDLLKPEKGLEWDIGAMPSFIPYVAERMVERGVDVSNGLERLKVISACPVGKGHMNINSEGGIMPCQFAQDWTIGSVREMTLQDAVSALYELDKQEAKGVCSPEACEYSRICRGCRAKAWQRTGDPMAEDVTCLLRADGDRSALLAQIDAAPDFARSAPCSPPGACG
ncbi:MAG: radical SAM protein [Coriobacteriia bacterium]|nr:radical SAM protein [Coriobacteriia bacterium]